MSINIPNIRIENDSDSGTSNPSIGPKLRISQVTQSQLGANISAGQLIGILGLTYAASIKVPFFSDFVPSLYVTQVPSNQLSDYIPKLRIF